jgi:hypothetical protein
MDLDAAGDELNPFVTAVRATKPATQKNPAPDYLSGYPAARAGV